MKINEKTASLYGKAVTNDVAPIIANGRTMLPVRFVAESLGATVEWNNDARYIRIVAENGNVIDMRVDEKGTFANGYYNELDVPPFVRNNRTYTPVRFIAESLGSEVYWINETQEVVILK
jgi:N-acetylmuramoyl-L-alanine amidase